MNNDKFLAMLLADLMMSVAAGLGAFTAIWVETLSLPKVLFHGVVVLLAAIVFFAAVDAAKTVIRK